MKIVIKIGGMALEDEPTLRKVARAVVDLSKEGHSVAVVHGGGTALTRTLRLLGKQSHFINGLRITDAETRDVALMVLAGLVNKKVVASIVRAGVPAVGLCGGDGMTFLARKKETQGYDLGFVGEICSLEPRWLDAIWIAGGIPVLSSLALGSDGEYYNVNADQVAGECATACHADTLIFLTDVPGVKGADGSVMPWLATQQVPMLIADSVVGGGMLPKLEACTLALRRGVGRVRILPAVQADILPQLCFENLDCGTEVVGA